MPAKVLTLAVVAALIIGAVVMLSGRSNDSKEDKVPVSSFSHAHGLAADVADSQKLYVATHNGLYLLENERELYRLGKAGDDYMGFSAHPTNPNVFFSSGHPTGGGNLGFQKSDDGGRSWKKLSNGVNGPVDFHAMAISQANPDLAYGFYRGQLQRSTDGGSTWQPIPVSVSNVISLTTHPKEPDVVYAATEAGLQVSRDRGQTWTGAAPNLASGAVAVLAINPNSPAEWVAYSEKQGLVKSPDAGQTWVPVKAEFGQNVVLYIAYSKQIPNTVYALTQDNALYKSADGGSWTKLR